MTDIQTMIGALRILSQDIQTDDGVANACIAEAASIIQELTAREAKAVGLIKEIRDDLKYRAQFTEQPNVLNISSGILHEMDDVLATLEELKEQS